MRSGPRCWNRLRLGLGGLGGLDRGRLDGLGLRLSPAGLVEGLPARIVSPALLPGYLRHRSLSGLAWTCGTGLGCRPAHGHRTRWLGEWRIGLSRWRAGAAGDLLHRSEDLVPVCAPRLGRNLQPRYQRLAQLGHLAAELMKVGAQFIRTLVAHVQLAAQGFPLCPQPVALVLRSFIMYCGGSLPTLCAGMAHARHCL